MYKYFNDYPQSVPMGTIPSVVEFRLVISHVLYAFLWYLYQQREGLKEYLIFSAAGLGFLLGIERRVRYADRH